MNTNQIPPDYELLEILMEYRVGGMDSKQCCKEIGQLFRCYATIKPTVPDSGGEEKTYNDSIIEQQREEYRKLYRENESLKQQLKEKQGWSDEDMWRAKEFGEINGAKTGYARQLWEDWLTEYKSKTNR